MKNKTICLVRMPSEEAIFGRYGVKMPPLALGIITGYLRERGITVEQFDLIPRMEDICKQSTDRSVFEAFFDKKEVFSYVNGGKNSYFDEFIRNLSDGIDIDKYDLIAISVGPDNSLFQVHIGLIFGGYIQRHAQKVIVYGGANLIDMCRYSPVYDELIKLMLRKFNYVISGPGEESLYRLVLALQEGTKEREIRRIKGILNLDENEGIIFNPPEKHRIVKPDFTGLRMEDYYNYLKKDDHLENMIVIYQYHFIYNKRLNRINLQSSDYEKRLVIPYIFNYNCPYKCAFCIESDLQNPAPVIGDTDQVVRELEELQSTYNTPYFYFINNAVNCSKKYVISLCKKIIQRDLRIYWSDCARFDNIDYDILRLMKQAGCRKLVFGMESGSKALVKRINKKIDLDYAEQVLSWCKEIGIWADLEIIIGMPTETEEDFQETYDYLKRNRKNINFITINQYIPIPGSTMFRYPEQYGIEIGGRATYEDILSRDLALFQKGKNPVIYNNMLKVYRYRDKEKRDFEQVNADAVKRIGKINKLLQIQFNEEMLSLF